MIESMACGTPVVAYRSGSVPEVVEDGVTGFIVGGEDEAVDAVKNRVWTLSRGAVRTRFEERFSARRMASDYVRVYGRLIADSKRPLGAMNGVGKLVRRHQTGIEQGVHLGE